MLLQEFLNLAHIWTMAFHHDRNETCIQISFIFLFFWFFLDLLTLSLRLILLYFFIILTMILRLSNVKHSSFFCFGVWNHTLYDFFVFQFDLNCLIENLFKRRDGRTLISIQILQTLNFAFVDKWGVLAYLGVPVLLWIHLDDEFVLLLYIFLYLLILLIENVYLHLVLLFLFHEFHFQLLHQIILLVKLAFQFQFFSIEFGLIRS